MITDLADCADLTATGVAATWRGFEERYLEGRYDGSGTADSVRFAAGPVPVLFCAGHAVTHVRDGVRKPADVGTGGLADLLADRAGTWSLTVTGLPAADPNYDPDGTFKQTLDELLPGLAAVVDLHGMKDGHGPDVCLGRGAVPELADPLVAVLRDEFEREGFVVSVDVPFAADRPTTLTSTAQLAGTPAVQIELARRTRTRTPAGQGDGRAVSALARAALRIAGFAPDRG